MIHADVLLNIIGFHVFVIVCFVIKHLWNKDDSFQLHLFYQEKSSILQKVVKRCRTLNQSYIPVRLWGQNGHIQSIAFGLLGRFGKIPQINSDRQEVLAEDGSRVTYDTFYPDGDKKNETILIVPGLANHAENNYIKSFTHHMTTNGFIVAVFNHTGALKSVKLNTPKIFNYGQTHDLDVVVQTIRQKIFCRKFIAVGFSLGGNLLMKYLGEKDERQNYVYFAASICQGYNVFECCELMKEKNNLRFLYNYGLTQKMLAVILRHKETFEKHEPSLNWKKISSSKSLNELDHEFTLKLSPEKCIKTYYENSSSSKYLHKIRIPILILNAKDDPLVPETLYKYPKGLVGINHDVLFVVTEHGGHLGYFEGGYIIPKRITWLDRMLLDYITTTLEIIKENKTIDS